MSVLIWLIPVLYASCASKDELLAYIDRNKPRLLNWAWKWNWSHLKWRRRQTSGRSQTTLLCVVQKTWLPWRSPCTCSHEARGGCTPHMICSYRQSSLLRKETSCTELSRTLPQGSVGSGFTLITAVFCCCCCVCVFAYMCACGQVCTVCVYVHACVCVHAWVCTCVCVFVCTCWCVCMHVFSEYWPNQDFFVCLNCILMTRRFATHYHISLYMQQHWNKLVPLKQEKKTLTTPDCLVGQWLSAYLCVVGSIVRIQGWTVGVHWQNSCLLPPAACYPEDSNLWQKCYI